MGAVAGALNAMLDDYHGGHTSHEQRELWAAVMRKHDYMLEGGSDPDELADLEAAIDAPVPRSPAIQSRWMQRSLSRKP